MFKTPKRAGPSFGIAVAAMTIESMGVTPPPPEKGGSGKDGTDRPSHALGESGVWPIFCLGIYLAFMSIYTTHSQASVQTTGGDAVVIAYSAV